MLIVVAYAIAIVVVLECDCADVSAILDSYKIEALMVPATATNSCPVCMENSLDGNHSTTAIQLLTSNYTLSLSCSP